MSKVPGMIETTEDVVGKPTLVRRVSNMLKDRSNSGPPMLFRHASMQKIRHCCQNLNLFPYLLYSFDNSKSHPIALKMHLCLDQFLQGLTARLFFLYKGFQQSLLSGIQSPEGLQQPPEPTKACKSTARFRKTVSQHKRKQSNPLFLIMAVYFAPLLLIFQLIGLCSLMVFGKYTPGFIFLISALFFLGCISLKILYHETVTHMGKREKLKAQ